MKHEQVVFLFGYPVDLEAVDLLFTSLLLQATGRRPVGGLAGRRLGPFARTRSFRLVPSCRSRRGSASASRRRPGTPSTRRSRRATGRTVVVAAAPSCRCWPTGPSRSGPPVTRPSPAMRRTTTRVTNGGAGGGSRRRRAGLAHRPDRGGRPTAPPSTPDHAAGGARRSAGSRHRHGTGSPAAHSGSRPSGPPPGPQRRPGGRRPPLHGLTEAHRPAKGRRWPLFHATSLVARRRAAPPGRASQAHARASASSSSWGRPARPGPSRGHGRRRPSRR